MINAALLAVRSAVIASVLGSALPPGGVAQNLDSYEGSRAEIVEEDLRKLGYSPAGDEGSFRLWSNAAAAAPCLGLLLGGETVEYVRVLTPQDCRLGGEPEMASTVAPVPASASIPASAPAAGPALNLRGYEGSLVSFVEDDLRARGYGQAGQADRWSFWSRAGAAMPCVGLLVDGAKVDDAQPLDSAECESGDGANFSVAASIPEAASVSETATLRFTANVPSAASVPASVSVPGAANTSFSANAPISESMPFSARVRAAASNSTTVPPLAVPDRIAALIGATVVQHHGGHHRSGRHLASDSREAEFERGYRDGRDGADSHNEEHDAAYSDGYSAGARERSNRMEGSRHAYEVFRRGAVGAPAPARVACARQADGHFNLAPGSATAVASASPGGDVWEVAVAAGYAEVTCTVSSGGDVRSMAGG